MQTLQVEKANALKAYNKADKTLKEVLETLFGKENLSQKVTDRIKTFEDALAVVKVSENLRILLDYNGQDKQMISSQAHAKISIIAEALNEGWKPDFSNSNETKYYPWLKFTPGVGFSSYDFVSAYSSSHVGSRLCFKTSDLAKYAAEQFQSIYNDFLN